MSKTRVIIFTVFVVAGIYDFAAEYVKLANVPTISFLFNKYLFQFSFWEFVVGLSLGHLIFNRVSNKFKKAIETLRFYTTAHDGGTRAINTLKEIEQT